VRHHQHVVVGDGRSFRQQRAQIVAAPDLGQPGDRLELDDL
jgi:hypothetical protein